MLWNENFFTEIAQDSGTGAKFEDEKLLISFDFQVIICSATFWS